MERKEGAREARVVDRCQGVRATAGMGEGSELNGVADAAPIEAGRQRGRWRWRGWCAVGVALLICCPFSAALWRSEGPGRGRHVCRRAHEAEVGEARRSACERREQQNLGICCWCLEHDSTPSWGVGAQFTTCCGCDRVGYAWLAARGEVLGFGDVAAKLVKIKCGLAGQLRGN